MISSSQEEQCQLVTSKDTLHILRLATILHVLQENVAFDLVLREAPGCSNVVTRTRVEQAKILFNCMTQHKATFVQVNKHKCTMCQLDFINHSTRIKDWTSLPSST